MTTLADAIIDEDNDRIREFLQAGTPLNQFDEYGFTPLIESAIVNRIDIAHVLIDYGADVNLQDETGQSPLHWAAENNNKEFCALLLEHGADPNAYSFAGQPVLVMPMLRKQRELRNFLVRQGASIEFAQDYINTKLLGHMFELVGTTNIIDPKNNFVEVDFEGFYLEFTLAVISESLSQFANHFGAKQLRRFTKLAEVIVEVLDRAAALAKYQQYLIDEKKYTKEIHALIEQEPLIIPVAYEGHAITFIKLDQIWVKCDRREETRLYDNIMFYHISRPEIVTPDFIQTLIYEKFPSEFINEKLDSMLGLKPLTELKVSAQISGNCSWANVEACIPALFFILFSSTPDFQKNMTQYKMLALNFFQQWREWNKERALNFCIQSFKKADSIRKANKAEILGAILFQCCSEESAVNEGRIEAILAILATPKYDYILKNYVKAYSYLDQTEQGKRFQAMLKKYGWTMPQKR